jgi:hypothetical protein
MGVVDDCISFDVIIFRSMPAAYSRYMMFCARFNHSQATARASSSSKSTDCEVLYDVLRMVHDYPSFCSACLSYSQGRLHRKNKLTVNRKNIVLCCMG